MKNIKYDEKIKVGETVLATMNDKDFYLGELVEIIDLFVPFLVKKTSGEIFGFINIKRQTVICEGCKDYKNCEIEGTCKRNGKGIGTINKDQP